METLDAILLRSNRNNSAYLPGVSAQAKKMKTKRRTQVLVMRIGRPTHFKPNNKNVSACGVVGPTYAAYDGRSVNCLACRRTLAWKVYMGVK